MLSLVGFLEILMLAIGFASEVVQGYDLLSNGMNVNKFWAFIFEAFKCN
jgi:hypothetical protein